MISHLATTAAATHIHRGASEVIVAPNNNEDSTLRIYLAIASSRTHNMLPTPIFLLFIASTTFSMRHLVIINKTFH